MRRAVHGSLSTRLSFIHVSRRAVARMGESVIMQEEVLARLGLDRALVRNEAFSHAHEVLVYVSAIGWTHVFLPTLGGPTRVSIQELMHHKFGGPWMVFVSCTQHASRRSASGGFGLRTSRLPSFVDAAPTCCTRCSQPASTTAADRWRGSPRGHG